MIQVHERTAARPVGRRARTVTDEGLDWAAAGWAGVVAGLAMILLETSLVSLFGGPGTDPVRQIAAIALSESVLPPLSPFTALVFLAAMSVHLPLSLLYARVLAAGVHGLRLGPAVAAGAAFGAALYAVNYYAFTSLFPWFAAGRGAITLLSHVAFGALAAATYAELAARRGRGSA